MDKRRSNESTATSENGDGTLVVNDRLPDREDRAAAARDAEAGLLKEVRASDIEPYTGLRYLSKLFRFMAIILVVLLLAEVVTGITAQGAMAIPTLLGEASRLIVLAGVLWGTGDLALLLVDVGHDVRAARILLARQTHHQLKDSRGGPSDRLVEQAARIRPINDVDSPPPIP